MQLLSTSTARSLFVDEACMSQGGLVDRQTAAAECDVLWTDPMPGWRAPPTAGQDLAPCPVCATAHVVR